MLIIDQRNSPQFFITGPTPCPYLPGKKERKIFTHLVGDESRALNTQLSQTGFRRSQNIVYRPACDACNACSSVRIPVQSFDWKKTFRRVVKRNQDVVATVTEPIATQEHYSLFRSYIDTRHSDGGMANMTVLDFAAMIDETSADSRLVEYRLARSHPQGGDLIATVLMDVMGDGLSLIYSFYDPTLESRSLGTLVVLDAIMRVQRLNLPYLYIGFHVRGAPKMEYKARFLPQERLTPAGWVLHR